MSIASPPRAHLTIGQLAELADVSANAVRFYKREGLMHVPPEDRQWLPAVRPGGR